MPDQIANLQAVRKMRCANPECSRPIEGLSNYCGWHQPGVRRLRAGQPPAPASERSAHRAASKHGPYSYGAPAPERIVVTDQMREEVMARRKAAEASYDPPFRAPFIWAFALALSLGLLSFIRSL